MEISLRQLQLLEFEIAKKIKLICEKYDIPYFLVGGTLLGAVRHGGFIPWDDDMDIGMLRADYERFLKCATNELDDGRFYLQTWDSEDKYGFPFAKMRLKNTLIKEKINMHLNIPSGIWVDILPYDDIAEINIKKKYRFYLMRILGKAYQLKCGYKLNLITERWVSKCINNIVYIIFKPIKKSIIKNMLYYLIQINQNEKENNYVIECDGMFKGNFMVPKQNCLLLEKLKFETEYFTVPSGFDIYLTNAYGDYMELPPIEEQVGGHGVVSVECL